MMVYVKQIANGSYYIFAKNKGFKNVWIVRDYYNDRNRKTPVIMGAICFKTIYFPKALIGKRVRFKIEVL
jgi:hypothetical protein